MRKRFRFNSLEVVIYSVFENVEARILRLTREYTFMAITLSSHIIDRYFKRKEIYQTINITVLLY